MKIIVKHTFKSITPFIWDNIPNLAVITGLNGAGKSHLLTLIKSNPDIVQTDDGTVYTQKDITFWNSEGGNFPNTHNFEIYDLVLLSSYIKKYKDPIDNILEQKNKSFGFNFSPKARIEQLISKTSLSIKGREEEIIHAIVSSSQKHIIDMRLEEVMYHFPEHLFLDPDNISNDRIEILFYMYHFRKYLDEKSGKDMTNYATPPWELLNQVFEISNLPYKIDTPTHIDIDFDIENLDSFFKPNSKYAYSIKLTHEKINEKINFKDISSGEKTIMSLAFLHYYAEKKQSYRKLLLLDEPDAHLHPSLTKQFLEVVDKFLIKKYGAKVIMTTHSPSTVGLCDEDSIFIMSKNPTKIAKQTRSEAINYLTSGIPILSSIIDDRRYILVEDTNDAKYFTKIYNIVNQEIDERISIVFIAVSTPEKTGGYTTVKTWAKKLRSGGMYLFKGLIDKDQGNNPEDGIVILNRYSIENYLLDPILIAGYLIHHGIINKIANIDFPGQNCNLIENLNDYELQSIADFVINLIETKFTITIDKINATRGIDKQIKSNILSENEKQRIEITYKNNKKVNYPKWILNRRGHDLESIYRESLPQSRNIGLDKMLDIQVRLPDFIPNDLIDVLKNCL